MQANAQDLFDAPHTRLYADHLFEMHNYREAASEYRRLTVFYPEDDSTKARVLLSYRLGGLYDSGKDYIHNYCYKNQRLPGYLNIEAEKILILNGSYDEADSIAGLSDSIDHIKYTFYNNALAGKWINARKIYRSASNIILTDSAKWQDILQRQSTLRYISPGLAMALSALVPGTGKFYTGDWKDGIYAMLLIGSLGYESYVGFHARGTSSVLGWVFGGLTVGFYGGNIYGSWQAARRYNEKLNHNLHEETRKLVIDDF